MFAQSIRCPIEYKRVEWWDAAEGPLPNADVQYPTLAAPAAFLCTANACSAPIPSGDVLAKKLARIAGN
ncbi:MAG TPA: hypothetical protein VK797_09015 [Tepidisphaeraceae bacterium]|nr:hypothetical protein [Tepidisphaeraceae bacterium]